MTLAKATVTGTVYRTPEERYTQNNVAIHDFILSLDDQDETLIRVISKRRVLADLLSGVKKGDKLLVDGRLQILTSKAPDGSDRKSFEIDANDIELVSGGSVSAKKDFSEVEELESSTTASKEKEIVTFAEEDLIDEEEIPF